MGQSESTLTAAEPQQRNRKGVSKKTATTLILVDCQKDFHPGGSLAIPSANEDAERIAKFIRDHGTKIDRIVATMDTHLKLHIAHPSFWIKGGGAVNSTNGSRTKDMKHPEPFTIISAEDLRKGMWKPRSDLILPGSLDHQLDPNIFHDRSIVLKNAAPPPPSSALKDNSSKNQQNEDIATKSASKMQLDLEKFCLEYTTRLEQQENSLKLCIWPEHCLLGSEGHCLVPIIREALNEWSEKTGRSVDFVCKGQKLLTEMFSAFKAEVPVSLDTALNTTLLDSLVSFSPMTCNRNITGTISDKVEVAADPQSHYIFVAGQALSHCVNYSVRDLVRYWEDSPSSQTKDSSDAVKTLPVAERPTQIALMTDCTSAVPGFEETANLFLEDMKSKGVHLVASTQIFPSSSSSSSTKK